MEGDTINYAEVFGSEPEEEPDQPEEESGSETEDQNEGASETKDQPDGSGEATEVPEGSGEEVQEHPENDVYHRIAQTARESAEQEDS